MSKFASIDYDLSESMVRSLFSLCAATSRTQEGARWSGLDGLNAHVASVRALETRGLVVWNWYRRRAKVTDAGWAIWDEASR